MTAKKRGLGRGLDALLGSSVGVAAEAVESEGELRNLKVSAIQAGKYQPRHTFDADKLEELAASIKSQGLIQPVVVRAIGDDRYELIAGERRWRAAQLAGLGEMPALIKEVADQAVVAMALIENIQREDLSPLEEAQAIERLIEEFSLTHQQAADAVGRSRASVSNLLRLLELPDEIRQMLDKGQLDMGHARALLTLSPARAVSLARDAVKNDWSVRQLEAAARDTGGTSGAKSISSGARDPNISALEHDLATKLATRVSLAHGRGGKGKLVIHYHSLDELDGILARIK